MAGHDVHFPPIFLGFSALDPHSPSPTFFPRACSSRRELDAVGLLDGRGVRSPSPSPLEILAVNDLEYFDKLIADQIEFELWAEEESEPTPNYQPVIMPDLDELI